MADSDLTPKFAPFFGMVSGDVGYPKRPWLYWRLGQAGIAAAMTFGCKSNIEDAIIHYWSFIQGYGAAYGTAKSGIGIAGVGTFRPDLIMKVRWLWRVCKLFPDTLNSHSSLWSCLVSSQCTLLWSQSSLLEIWVRHQVKIIAYSSTVTQSYKAKELINNWISGFMHLACGLSVGLTGLAAGYAIGIVGDMGVRSYMQQSRIFVGMVLILIFGEVLGLYGSVYLLSCQMESLLTTTDWLSPLFSTRRAEARLILIRISFKCQLA